MPNTEFETDHDTRVPSSPPSQGARVSAWKIVLGVLLVAIGASLFAVAFRGLLWLVLQTLGGVSDVVSAMRKVPWWGRVVLPGIGGLAAGGLAVVAARAPGGRGIGDVMEAVVMGRVRLSLPSTLLKSLGSWCAIISGGSIGREGPIIQFGGALGKVVGTRLGFSGKKTRMLIAVGAAAGFAAAYNTPFAAVLFVLEVVAGVFVGDLIVPLLVASVIATQITRMLLGTGPVYGQRAFSMNSPLELVGYALLGLVAALVAQAFMRLLSFVEQLLAAKVRAPWRSACGGVLAGLIVALLPEVAGNGYEPLNQLLDGHFSYQFVAALLLAKCVATAASVGSGNPGGVFTPTLLLGGATGYLFGVGVYYISGYSWGVAAGYALVGMAATTAATTHAPLMAAVMVFELSGDYAIVLPLALATAIASEVSRKFRKDSIYTAELRERGVDWERSTPAKRLW